jgi:selenide,water dikinase
LARLPAPAHPDLLVGISTSDDAGVFRLRDDLAIVNTVDFFTPVVDDPYTFGAISATNSLSDVYAMGGVPVTALNVVCFPRAELDDDVLSEILRGGSDKAAEAGVVIVGGHTVDDPEIKYGMAVTGTIHPGRIVRNVGARPGDALVLTKPLGTGILTTALKRETLSDAGYRAVVASMSTLNRSAAEAMLATGVHAATDVTGYGLLGHAYEMAHGNGVTLRFEASSLPLFPDLAELVAAGFLTGGCKRNRSWIEF